MLKAKSQLFVARIGGENVDLASISSINYLLALTLFLWFVLALCVVYSIRELETEKKSQQ